MGRNIRPAARSAARTAHTASSQPRRDLPKRHRRGSRRRAEPGSERGSSVLRAAGGPRAKFSPLRDGGGHRSRWLDSAPSVETLPHRRLLMSAKVAVIMLMLLLSVGVGLVFGEWFYRLYLSA